MCETVKCQWQDLGCVFRLAFTVKLCHLLCMFKFFIIECFKYITKIDSAHYIYANPWIHNDTDNNNNNLPPLQMSTFQLHTLKIALKSTLISPTADAGDHYYKRHVTNRASCKQPKTPHLPLGKQDIHCVKISAHPTCIPTPTCPQMHPSSTNGLQVDSHLLSSPHRLKLQELGCASLL